MSEQNNGRGSILRIPAIFVIALTASIIGWMAVENFTRKAEASELRIKYETQEGQLRSVVIELRRTNDRLDQMLSLVAKLRRDNEYRD